MLGICEANIDRMPVEHKTSKTRIFPLLEKKVCMLGPASMGMYVVPTDIYHLAKAVKPTWTDPNAKTWDLEVHYQHGIGAKRHQYISNQWGLMTGTGVGERTRDGYSWLSNRYQKEDEVFLVGYSRGVFTARSVGAMISKYGLIK